MDYDNNLRGFLMKNTEKEKDTQPDYKGSVVVDGVEYWLSGWIKTSKQGNKFMSLSVQPKQQQAAKPARQAKQAPQAVDTSGFDDMDSDLPF